MLIHTSTSQLFFYLEFEIEILAKKQTLELETKLNSFTEAIDVYQISCMDGELKDSFK